MYVCGSWCKDTPAAVFHMSLDLRCRSCVVLADMQSLVFLLAAEDFTKRFEEAPAAKADSYHQQYVAIVDKFIRERSPYEVNIESKVKREILRTADKEVFDALSTVFPSISALTHPRRVLLGIFPVGYRGTFCKASQVQPLLKQLLCQDMGIPL